MGRDQNQIKPFDYMKYLLRFFRYFELIFWLNIRYKEDVKAEIKWKYQLNRTILLLRVDKNFENSLQEDRILLE